MSMDLSKRYINHIAANLGAFRTLVSRTRTAVVQVAQKYFHVHPRSVSTCLRWRCPARQELDGGFDVNCHFA